MLPKSIHSYSIFRLKAAPHLFGIRTPIERNPGLEVKLRSENGRNVLSAGFKLKTYRNGTLFLKGYSQIITEDINSATPIYVDQDALVAFEDSV